MTPPQTVHIRLDDGSLHRAGQSRNVLDVRQRVLVNLSGKLAMLVFCSPGLFLVLEAYLCRQCGVEVKLEELAGQRRLQGDTHDAAGAGQSQDHGAGAGQA